MTKTMHAPAGDKTVVRRLAETFTAETLDSSINLT